MPQSEPIDEITQALNTTQLWLDSGYYSRVKPFLIEKFIEFPDATQLQVLNKYEHLAFATFFSDNYSLSAKYVDSIETLMDKSEKEEYFELYVLLMRGDIAMKEKRYDEAFDYYFKGKQIVDIKGNACKRRPYDKAIAFILFKQENYIEALTYFLSEYNAVLDCNTNEKRIDYLAVPGVLINVGYCYEILKNYDTAISYYNLGLAYIEDFGHLETRRTNTVSVMKGVLLGNLGGSLLKLNRYGAAEQALKESININFRQGRDFSDAILTKIKLADLYLQKNHLANCDNLIIEISQDIIEHPNLIAESRLANLRYNYYSKIENYQQALIYRNLNIELKDSIKKSAYKMNLQRDYKKEFQNAEQKLALANLQKDKETQTFYLIISLIIIVVIIIITITLLRKRIESHKHIKELTKLNKTIQTKNTELQNSLALLQNSQEENTRIMRIVAHDLRSPIAGIIGLVRLIKNDTITKEEIEKYIDLVEKSGNNALSFIDNLLFLNNATNASILEKVDIKIVLESCFKLAEPQAAKKQQYIYSEIFSIEVTINQEKIWRVINNLLNNAIKFSKAKSTIILSLKKQESSILISVKDNGIGIPNELKNEVFNMFSTVGRPGESGEVSFGLGLAISKQIVEAHKGKIWFESQENEGSTFYVELPI